MKIGMKVFLSLCVVSLRCSGATALAQQPAQTEVDELVARYQPRLQWLTARAVEGIWRERQRSEPWYRHLHAQWETRKDDPHIADTFRDSSCAEIDLSAQDTTFQGHAKQFRCTGEIGGLHYSGQKVVHANLSAAGLLTSAVIVARIPLPFPDPGIGSDEQAGMRELLSDVWSRVDNARAPPGVRLEYSKDLDTVKFVVQFR